MLAAFNFSIKAPGFPAPVVITFTPSSIQTFICCSTSGRKSIKLTPNGLEVISLAFLICCLKSSGSIPPPAIIPRPPSLETAPANSPPDTQAIAPWNIGYLIPNNSHILLFFIKVSSIYLKFISPYIKIPLGRYAYTIHLSAASFQI